jgi:hypothetical protein
MAIMIPMSAANAAARSDGDPWDWLIIVTNSNTAMIRVE